MRDEELGRVFGPEEEIIPSSGFVAAVMEAVESEALAPRPVPFPWKRALPGLVSVGVAFVWLVVEFARVQLGPTLPMELGPDLGQILEAGALGVAGVVLSLGLAAVSRRLVGWGHRG